MQNNVGIIYKLFTNNKIFDMIPTVKELNHERKIKIQHIR